MARHVWMGVLVSVVSSLGLPAAAAPLILEPSVTLSSPDPAYSSISSLALDGDFLVMGASHSASFGVFVFQRQSNGTWRYVQRLLTNASGADTGIRVAIRGSLIAVHFTSPSGSGLLIFERTTSGWRSSPVANDFQPYAPVYSGDVEIDNGTVILGGGPKPGEPYCTSHNMRAYRKNTNGTWAVVGRAFSDPITNISPPEAACLLGADVAVGGNSTVLSAIELANPEHAKAAYIFGGPPNAWSAPARLFGYAGPVGVRDDIAVLSGTEVFQRISGAWQFKQRLERPDRLMLFPPAPNYPPALGKVRDNLAVIGYLDAVSVFQANSQKVFSEAARLMLPGTLMPADDAEPTPIPWYPTSVDVAGRRVVLNDLYTPKVYLFELPVSISVPATAQDTFEAGAAAQWTPLPGSSWSVVASPGSRVYRQSSLAEGAGSYLGNMDWTNQSIQADIRPTASAPGSDRWFGLVVRRTDAANYYYLTARTSNSLQLKKMVNGSYQTLASTGFVFSQTRSYRLRLEATGATLRAYIDDALVLQAADSSLTHGHAGLQLYKTAAEYDNIVVSPIAQLTIMADDFNSSQSDSWTLIHEGVWSRASSYQQTSLAGGAGSITGAATGDQIIRVSAGANSFASSGSPWFGLVARYKDIANYYYVTLRKNNVVALRKLVNGQIVELDSAPLSGVSTGTGYRLRFEAVGNQLRLYVDGRLVLEASDAAHVSGRYGLYTYRTAAQFDDFVVTQP